ncbi:SIS domain-containing protein [Paenibacillus tarimensis]
MFTKEYTSQEIINKAKVLLEEEIQAIHQTKNYINHGFYDAVNLLAECSGKVVITGIGKSGYVSRKMAATMVSLGITAVYMNPADAIHGDLGLVQSNDIVITVSKSGESQEIISILPSIKQLKAKVISITANSNSTIANFSNVTLQLGVEKEAGYLNLAPTSSVVSSLALGDALATIASELRGFNEENFAMYHPGGSIGKKLTLHVEDLLSENSYSIVGENDSFKKILIELTEKRIGATAVSKEGKITGIITDGDLKRVLEKFGHDCFALTASKIMSAYPIVVQKGTKAVLALELMEGREHSISVIPVLDGEKLLGILRIHDILKNL